MAEIKALERALINADRAGDVQAATKLAAEIKRLRFKPVSFGKEGAEQALREELAEANWIERNLAGIGTTASNFVPGIKQLFGGELSPEETAQVEANRVIRQEAPVGAFGGDVLTAVMPGGIAMKAGQIAQLPKLAKAGKELLSPSFTLKGTAAGAGVGGAVTAVQPTLEGESRATNVMLGTTAGAAFPAVGAVLKLGKAIIDPATDAGQRVILGRRLADIVGEENVPRTIEALRNAPELVPGSLPTAGQASGSGGIAALERSISAVSPEEYAARFQAQNVARVDELDDLAGTAGKRELFAAERDATADQLYKSAFETGIDPGAVTTGVRGEITKLMKRPSVQDALKDARRLAKEEGVNLAKQPEGSVQGLHYIKKALDNKLSTNLGNEERRLIAATRDRFLTLTDRLSPDYAAARGTFRDMSKPINQMDIAQEILTKSRDPLTGNIQPRSFAKSLSDDTAAKATGFRGSTLENTLAPDQLARLNAIKDDLARSVAAQTAGRGVGSDTAQKLAFGNIMDQIGVGSVPQLLSTPVQLAGYFSRALYGSADKEMREKLARGMLDPKTIADLMSDITPSQQALMIQDLMRTTGTPMTIGGALSLQNQR